MHSFSCLWAHIVFSTKERRPFLRHRQLRQRLHAYMAEVYRHCGAGNPFVGGVEDHVHCLCMLPRNLSVADLLGEAKTATTKWIKKQDSKLRAFAWQTGYGAFSVGASQVGSVRTYIANQEEHHKRYTFKEEFERLLDLYEVEYDRKWLWD